MHGEATVHTTTLKWKLHVLLCRLYNTVCPMMQVTHLTYYGCKRCRKWQAHCFKKNSSTLMDECMGKVVHSCSPYLYSLPSLYSAKQTMSIVVKMWQQASSLNKIWCLSGRCVTCEILHKFSASFLLHNHYTLNTLYMKNRTC